MTGIQYVVDDHGQKMSVVINLKKYGALWEDFCDLMIAEKRKSETRKSLSTIKKRLKQSGKL